ncbi:MAG: DUF5916 domain-containing protein [Bacteroidota bacterium]
MKFLITISVLLWPLLSVFAQNARELEAYRIDEPIKIDGQLDEETWQSASAGSDFTTLRPNPDLPSSEHSSVRILFDDEGIYVGAELFDSKPDSILRELTERDDLGNTDFFGVVLDPYQSGINGFTFITTPGDVQFDAIQSVNGEDNSWDAVWNSKAQLTGSGWTVEMFIPYSAIRFPASAEQTWGINFVRMIRRKNEQSFWDDIDPNIDGFLNQAGKLTGLRDIKSPFRLQLTPFVTAVGVKQYDPNSTDPSQIGTSFGGGMDLKLGLNDAFTLDMTLIPDFSEARSDNNQLNLGPFEQFFSEQRAFFTEGTELFNKGDLFYSRRVGGRLYNTNAAYDDLADGEEIVEMPGRAQLVNATKISGRTTKGTGLGFFNGIEQRSFATIENMDGERRDVQVHPRTNYNVMVVDQNLPNNSSVTLVNTNVMREGGATDANVTALLFDIHNKSNEYAIAGEGKLSQRFTEGGNTESGHALELRAGRISGKWQYSVWYREQSDTYNPNDLGINFRNNRRSFNGRIRYNRFEPFLNGFFLNGGAGMYVGHYRLYRPDEYTGSNVEMWVYGQTKHFWNFNFWTDHNPGWQYDYFEPRVAGRVFRNSGMGNLGGWIGTDSRKKLRLNGNFNINHFWRDDLQRSFRFNIGARYRANDRLSLNAFFFQGDWQGDIGYVNQETRSVTLPEQEPIDVTDVFMGRRNRLINELGVEAKYSFTANMTLNLRARHYWDRVQYDSFHLLNENGSLGATDYENNHNVDFDAFNIDLIYRWRFAPGSDIFLVYKTGITAFSDQTSRNYTDSFSDLFRDAPSTQSLSLKMVYWLDYASVVM